MNLISTCCAAEAREDYKTSLRDHHEAIPIYVCSKCGDECEVEDRELTTEEIEEIKREHIQNDADDARRADVEDICASDLIRMGEEDNLD